MSYLVLKAIHIIFVVSYFAGIFYLVRIFVYYKDTDGFLQEKKKILREQYVFMARRLWNIITVPAGMLMLISGSIIVYFNSILLKESWFHLKIFFLIILGVYHYWSWKKVLELKKLKGFTLPTPNLRLRHYNEIATFLLFLIVFTVVLKSFVINYAVELMISFLILVLVITFMVKLVNKKHTVK